MFRAFKRLWIWLGLMAEQSTETDAINIAQVEAGLRREKDNAQKCFDALTKIKAQAMSISDQLKGQQRQKADLQSYIQAAINQNDESKGAEFANQLADLEAQITTNQGQLDGVNKLYDQTKEMLADHLNQLKQFQADFEATKAKVAISRSLDDLARTTASMIPELQGSIGGEMSRSMEQLRQASIQGQARMTATMDLASKVGSDIKLKQSAREMKGKDLLEQYKAKMAAEKSGTTVAVTSTAPATPERQKIAS